MGACWPQQWGQEAVLLGPLLSLLGRHCLRHGGGLGGPPGRAPGSLDMQEGALWVEVLAGS